MINFALRQFRTQGLVAVLALIALGTVALVTGPHLVHLYDTTVVHCQEAGDCGTADAALAKADGHLNGVFGLLMLALPAIVGIFWGAPLIARELESGTFRVAWTQSVTRTRWLLVKLGLVGLAAVAVVGLVSWIVTWWSNPIDRMNGMGFGPTFDERDIVPIAYVAFAFALGVVLGLLIRRTLPAMAATLGGFIAVRFAVLEWIRPHLASPLRIVSGFAEPSGSGQGIEIGGGLRPGDWVLNEEVVGRGGRVVSQGGFDLSLSRPGNLSLAGQQCPGHFQVKAPSELANAVRQCAAELHLSRVITYQPSSRFWPFQWEESAIFVGLALLLVGFCFWWVRRTYGGSGPRRSPSPSLRSTPAGALDADRAHQRRAPAEEAEDRPPMPVEVLSLDARRDSALRDREAGISRREGPASATSEPTRAPARWPLVPRSSS